MASLALGIVPSDEEVNAIKQQLKLLGHSLPTEVIVKFLQENNELLTACQNPKYGLTIGEDPTARSQPASRWPDVQSNTERAVQSHQDTAVLESFSEAVQKSGSAAPQLDVTWASAGPDGVLTSRVLHNNRRDPFPAPIPTEQKPACTEVTQAAAVRRDRHDQLMCTRDFLSRPLHSVLDAGHDQDRYALEHDFRTLNSELDDLAASLRHDDSHSYSRRASSQHGDICRKSSRGYSPSPGSVLRSSSLHSLPVLNNSFIVPAQAAKPQKVDRVTRHRELQQVWNKDSFLRSGGTAKTSKRRGENFNELYAACHAAEDKLKELTLKHGKAAKGTLKGKGQQENVAPTDKRRDALRWETRMRMQLRDGYH
ncbi:hypothetical protein WJX79_006452 [Trebouxia sp. C0005]